MSPDLFTHRVDDAEFDRPGLPVDLDQTRVEHVLGGLISTNDLDKLPGLSANGGNMVFSFKCDPASIDGSTALVIEVGTTLATWPTSYGVGSDTACSTPGVTVATDTSQGFDTIPLTAR